MIDKILESLKDLPKSDYELEVQDDAWYSVKSMTRAIGGDFIDLPSKTCVRVYLKKKKGMLELHPTENNEVDIKCYCFFQDNNIWDKGVFPLEKLKETVESFKDHHCPPWPG